MPRPTLLARAAFCAALLLFVCAKLPHLSYPFYWDESWVYAPAIHTMYRSGVSLLPDALPTDLSRGHPLLFPAMHAAWMHIAGTSHAALHGLSLAIALALVIAVFVVMGRRFGYETALIAALLLLCTHEFFIASTFIFNDILLALLSFLALHLVTSRRYWPAAIVFTAAVLVKESGWALWAATCAAMLVCSGDHRLALRQKSIVVLLPLAAIVAFLALQKHMLGWYLYPSHTSSINLTLPGTLAHLQASMRAMFIDAGNYVPWALATLLTGICYARTRDRRYLAALAFAAFVWCNIYVFSYKDAVFYAFVASLAVAIPVVLSRRHTPGISPQQQSFLKMTLITGVTFTIFCCVNFFETRYLFPAMLVFHVILLAVILRHLFKVCALKTAYRIALIAACIAGNCSYHTSLLEYDRMSVYQEVTQFMENAELYGASIASSCFFERLHLTSPESGYLRGARVFTGISTNITPETEFVITDNTEPGYPDCPPGLDSCFYLFREIRKGGAGADIYRRRGEPIVSH